MGYVGAALKLTEAQLALQPIQMGARVYIPALGRFLSVDPMDGGTANTYVYVNDPVNDYDLGGTIGWKKWFKDRWGNTKSIAGKVKNVGKSGLAKTRSWGEKHPEQANVLITVLTMGRGGGKAGKGGRNPLESALRRLEIIRNPAPAAKELGYTKQIPRGELPFTKNQPAFQKGQRYITPDLDGHKGGVWKMFDNKGRRLGTFDENLKRIGD